MMFKIGDKVKLTDEALRYSFRHEDREFYENKEFEIESTGRF